MVCNVSQIIVRAAHKLATIKMSVVPFYVSVYVCDVMNTRRDVVLRYKIVIVRVLQCCVHTKLFYLA